MPCRLQEIEAFNAECAKFRSIFSRLDYPTILLSIIFFFEILQATKQKETMMIVVQ